MTSSAGVTCYLRCRPPLTLTYEWHAPLAQNPAPERDNCRSLALNGRRPGPLQDRSVCVNGQRRRDSTLSPSPPCSALSGRIPHWDGSGWLCSALWTDCEPLHGMGGGNNTARLGWLMGFVGERPSFRLDPVNGGVPPQ